MRVAPETLGLDGVAEMQLRTPDGQALVAWYALPAKGQPTIFYLHGNAGALVHRAGRVRLYRSYGYGLFLLAYRGFSGSTGAPSETGIVEDAVMAFDRVASFTPPDSAIVIYGESLGTGVAVQLAAKRQAAGVILESPFSSAVDVGAYLYPYLPVHWLLKDRFESINYIGKIKIPLLVLQGGQDRIVPAHLGRKLFAAAPGPKQALFIPEANHYTLYELGAFDKVRSFLDRFQTRPGLPPGTDPGLMPGMPEVELTGPGSLARTHWLFHKLPLRSGKRPDSEQLAQTATDTPPCFPKPSPTLPHSSTTVGLNSPGEIGLNNSVRRHGPAHRSALPPAIPLAIPHPKARPHQQRRMAPMRMDASPSHCRCRSWLVE
ncbi:MAG: alpha/beta hydrolase [Rhodomicrobium sp.]|nr:alpha/beta hydrolase [Rhodomicrobium sp.]